MGGLIWAKRSQRKKIIDLSIILAILVCIGTAGFIWCKNSPLPTVLKMATAFQEGDMGTVLDCIEPETAKKIEFVVGLTGVSANDLFDKLISIKSDKENELEEHASKSSIKLSGYQQEGDNASISVTITNGNTTSSLDIHFIRVSNTWYLSLE